MFFEKINSNLKLVNIKKLFYNDKQFFFYESIYKEDDTGESSVFFRRIKFEYILNHINSTLLPSRKEKLIKGYLYEKDRFIEYDW